MVAVQDFRGKMALLRLETGRLTVVTHKSDTEPPIRFTRRQAHREVDELTLFPVPNHQPAIFSNLVNLQNKWILFGARDNFLHCVHVALERVTKKT